MGVCWILEFDRNVKVIERILEAVGAEVIGPFSVDATPYVPAVHQQEQVEISLSYVIHHSNFPQTTFSIVPTENNFKNSPKVVCDRGFDLILSKMSNGTVPDTMGRIEINGNSYQLADFIIRIGTAIQGTTVKGVVVEVDFEPCHVVTQCQKLIEEFIIDLFIDNDDEKPEEKPPGEPKTTEKPVDKLAERLGERPVIFQDNERPENYTPLDTMWQYVQLAMKLRKKT